MVAGDACSRGPCWVGRGGAHIGARVALVPAHRPRLLGTALVREDKRARLRRRRWTVPCSVLRELPMRCERAPWSTAPQAQQRTTKAQAKRLDEQAVTHASTRYHPVTLRSAILLRGVEGAGLARERPPHALTSTGPLDGGAVRCHLWFGFSVRGRLKPSSKAVEGSLYLQARALLESQVPPAGVVSLGGSNASGTP